VLRRKPPGPLLPSAHAVDASISHHRPRTPRSRCRAPTPSARTTR
jgi:hypothetical protein